MFMSSNVSDVSGKRNDDYFSNLHSGSHDLDGIVIRPSPLNFHDIDNDDPTWRKVVSCLPVVGIVMQFVNWSWIADQDARIVHTDNGNAKIRLLEKASLYENFARVSYLITLLALSILTVCFPGTAAIGITALGCILLNIIMQIVIAYRIESNDDELRDLRVNIPV